MSQCTPGAIVRATAEEERNMDVILMLSGKKYIIKKKKCAVGAVARVAVEQTSIALV